jgi:hypothetical protein
MKLDMLPPTDKKKLLFLFASFKPNEKRNFYHKKDVSVLKEYFMYYTGALAAEKVDNKLIIHL